MSSVKERRRPVDIPGVVGDARGRGSGRAGDGGDIVIGWLSKLALVIAVIGVALFDGIAIGTTQLAITDQASVAARAASGAWQSTQNVQTAYETALAAAHEANNLNEIPAESFTIDPDGTVHLVLRREATTFVVHRSEHTRPWAQLSTTATGKDVS